MSDATPPQRNDLNWPKDEFGRGEVAAQVWIFWGWVAVGLIAIGLSGAFWIWKTASEKKLEVVAYCAQDQVYAEPIFSEFEKETGVKVRAVYDSEAVKTVGWRTGYWRSVRIHSATSSGAMKKCEPDNSWRRMCF